MRVNLVFCELGYSRMATECVCGGVGGGGERLRKREGRGEGRDKH